MIHASHVFSFGFARYEIRRASSVCCSGNRGLVHGWLKLVLRSDSLAETLAETPAETLAKALAGTRASSGTSIENRGTGYGTNEQHAGRSGDELGEPRGKSSHGVPLQQQHCATYDRCDGCTNS